jgi:oxalate decarboxylase
MSLSDWLTHTPPDLVLQHLPITQNTLSSIPTEKKVIVP